MNEETGHIISLNDQLWEDILQHWVQQITNYIEEHYAQPLTLSLLSDMLHTSPYHLQRMCKKIKGISPAADIALSVGFPNAAHFATIFLVQGDNQMLPYTDELRQYFLGNIQTFTFVLNCRGTVFQQSVWQALLQIPHGRTQSYSDIAEAIGQPSAVRAVGTAIGANPVRLAVPCHRVIGMHGALSGYRGGLESKSALLQLEQRSLTPCSPN
jgi:methylated-DNA-[protein]-cysteine S-methyltransferase